MAKRIIVATNSKIYKAVMLTPAFIGFQVLAVRVEQDCFSYVEIEWAPVAYWRWKLNKIIKF